MTNDGSLRMFAELRVKRKRGSSSLKTSEDCLPLTTGKLLQESVQKWHTTVSADGNGILYERLESELHTDVIDGSALLPTPRAAMADGRNMKPWLRPLDKPQNLENAIARMPLLPTPQAGDCKVFGPGIDWKNRKETRQPSVASVLMNLLYEDGQPSRE